MNRGDNSKTRSTRLAIHFWVLVAGWTIIIAVLLGMDISRIRHVQREMASNEARALFKKDQAYRFWASSHGGVYVPVAEKTPPNPYLSHVPERDIKTPSGKLLTLMNPAYMLRQMMDEYRSLYGARGHITSLKPFRPETSPDEWERSALIAFEDGVQEVFEFSEINGELYLRLMRPMVAKKKCLKCHAKQGYKVGDIRGGVSISLPMAPYLADQRRVITTHVASFGILWILGLSGIGLATHSLRRRIKDRDKAEAALQKAHDELELRVEERTAELTEANTNLKHEIEERKRAEEEREKLIKELQDALAEVKTLSGLIPICSFCKKIRDDKGYWNQIESYIRDHSEAEFSHSICPKCEKRFYPDLDEDEE